jgi:hypothetical protein
MGRRPLMYAVVKGEAPKRPECVGGLGDSRPYNERREERLATRAPLPPCLWGKTSMRRTPQRSRHAVCQFTPDNSSSANSVKDERFSLNGQIKRTLLGLLARFHTENRPFVGAARTASLKVRKNPTIYQSFTAKMYHLLTC